MLTSSPNLTLFIMKMLAKNILRKYQRIVDIYPPLLCVFRAQLSFYIMLFRFRLPSVNFFQNVQISQLILPISFKLFF